jgi:hypothetical protein
MTDAIIQHLASLPSSCPANSSSLESCISALKSSISALESCLKTTEGSSAHWETFGWLCAVAVGIGIAGEIVVIVSEHLEGLDDWERGIIRPPEKPPAWRFWFDIAATVIVLAGVFGEAGATAKVSSINSQLRSRTSELRAKSDQLVAVITEEAGDAAASAEKAQDTLRQVQQDADALRHQMRIQGPREVLLNENKDGIVKALKPFPRQNLTVVGCGVMPALEEATLATGIVGLTGSVEHGAGWSATYKSWSPCWSLAFPGILVIATTTQSSVDNAAKALASALQNAGIVSEQLPNSPSFKSNVETPGSPFEWARKDPTRIFLLVGPNPMAEEWRGKQNKKRHR